MDKDFYLNPRMQFEQSIQRNLMTMMPEMNFSTARVNSQMNWGKLDQNSQFEHTLFSNQMMTSPVSPVSNSSPQKMNLPIMDQFVKENLPRIRNSISLDPNLPLIAADPGFAERAAKFSCFGSRSFNGRTSQFRSNNALPLIGQSNLPRVSSSPSLKINGSTMAIQDNKISHESHALGYENKTSSNEESSVSEQMEISNSRKRKAASLKGKAKEIVSVIVKEEGNEELNLKKLKKTEENVIEKTEEKLKIPEPPKDYIHVRARRGQATDSHSLAERVRREKIGERMKLLQDLVPGCNKVTGKALMLDEIINYVQSLQHQVEFLSMKLATVNPRQEFDMNNHISKDMNQSNGNLSHQLYPIESSTSDFYQQQTRQQQQVLFIGSAPITQSPVDPLNPVLGFTENFSQFAGFEGDDLHSLVKMGFGENHNHTSDMKIEL